MKNRVAGLVVAVGVLVAATSATTVATAQGGEAEAAPARPAPTSLVSSDGRVVAVAEALPAGSGQAFDPGELVADLGLGTVEPVDAGPRAAAGTESVFGPDGRTQVGNPTTWPSSAIGSIQYRQGFFVFRCTGVLIDRNTVLTAGSCVKEGGSGTGAGAGWHEELTFAAGQQGVSADHGVCGQSQLLTPAGWATSADENQNWGLVQLNCSAGNSAGWMGYRAESVDANLLNQPITVRGYPGDRAYGTMWTMDDQVRALTADLIFTQADLDPQGEQLGAPAWQSSGCNGPCILGVIGDAAHGSTAPHSTNNHGVRITTARANDIAAAAAANNGPVAGNDDFASSTLLSGQEGSIAFDSTGASLQAGEPDHARQAGLASLWYRWTAPTTGYAIFDTEGTAFDTLLAAYTGSSLTNLTERSSNHVILDVWSAEMHLPVTAGTTYRIAVDGQDANAGPGTLSWHLDVTKPTVSVATPAAGATYTQGQVVNAAYSCADETGGSGLDSCTGTVANGSPIDTASPGVRIFSVTATDLAGNQHQVTRSYTVTASDTAGPSITITTPPAGAVYEVGQAVTADYGCADPSGVASCVGNVADGAAAFTTRVGNHSFTVVATDARGNTAQLTRSYRVVRHRADGHVRRNSEQAFVGNDVVNTTGVGQTRSAGVARSASTTFVVRVQNDGSVADAFGVLGTGTSTSFTGRWFAGPTDVTAQVRAGTYRTAQLAPGATAALRVVVAAKATSARGQSVTLSTRFASVGVPTQVDVVRTTVTRA